MSRTFRRRNCHLRDFYVPCPQQVDEWDLWCYQTKDPHRVVSLRSARFHRDHKSGRWNAPSWYARQLRKAQSRAGDTEIRRCLVSECWDDHLPERRVKNANYYW